MCHTLTTTNTELRQTHAITYRVLTYKYVPKLSDNGCHKNAAFAATKKWVAVNWSCLGQFGPVWAE